MNLKKILSPSVIADNLSGNDKETVITNMVAFLISLHGIENGAAITQCVLDREKKDSTGLEYGIAIPHGKTPLLQELVIGVGRLKNAVVFDSRDAEPVRILVMTIAPTHKPVPHLQFMSAMLRVLRDKNKRNMLVKAPDSEAMYEIITS